MKEMVLSKGFSTWVDDEDYEYLRQFSWHAVVSRGTVYARTSHSPMGRVYMHVLLLKPKPPLIVRHLNDIGVHNWRSNLKIATQTENHLCATQRLGRKSNLPRGVTQRPWGSYQAQITINHKVHYLGVFNTKEEAANVYLRRRQQVLESQ